MNSYNSDLRPCSYIIPRVSILFFAIVLSVSSCKSNPAKAIATKEAVVADNPSPVKAYSYDLTHWVKKWRLPDELLEISGNTWIDNDHLLVIEDTHPNLYLVKLLDSTVTIEKNTTFQEDKSGKKVDIEDITCVGDTAYALWSHGSIYKITDWKNKPVTEELPTFLSKENNTEGICFDPVSGTLLVSCKGMSDVEDEKKSTKAIYQFDLATKSLRQEPFMLIHKKEFKSESGEKIKFYPSAIAVHPMTHDIYILSTKDSKCMAVFSHSGELKSVVNIDRSELLQPEGICFAPDGTLYISTEGKNGTSAYIYSFNEVK